MNCSTKTHKTTKKETLLGQARRNKCEQNKKKAQKLPVLELWDRKDVICYKKELMELNM